MSRPVEAHDKGTRFTNYSSIHSADAFVGDYQVMYTPGSTSPHAHRQAARKPSRFSRAVSASKNMNVANQSYLFPANMLNTSQILPDQGILPNIQVQYNIPADEKQIVASLRSLQRDLADAMQTINELTRERDEALHEIRLLRATSRKPHSPVKRQSMAERVEEELFDLSKSEESFKRTALRHSSSRRSAAEDKVEVSDNARVLPPIPTNVVNSVNKSMDKRSTSTESKHGKSYKAPVAAEETEQSIVADDPTAASNTSRRLRRRPSIDDNMTSAYILPDITEQQIAQPQLHVSKEAQDMLHSLEPEHIVNCDVCRRLTNTHQKSSRQQRQKSVQLPPQTRVPQESQRPQAQHVHAKVDYTAQALGFLSNQPIGFSPDESMFPASEATMRPKIDPAQALSRVHVLMNAQFLRAKERHNEAWKKYDGIDAPLNSRKHAAVGKEMRYWAEKMEECRVHLDYLRDVEEGME